MTKSPRFLPSILALAALALSTIAVSVMAADPPAAPPPPATAPSVARSFNDVMQDFQAALGDLRTAMTSPAVFSDPAQRTAAAPKAIPALKRLKTLKEEFATTGDQGAAIAAQIGGQFEQMLLMFGDADTLAQNKARAADPDPKIASTAQQNLMLSDWVRNPDVANQTKVLDSAQAMAKKTPDDVQLCQTLALMSHLAPATPDLAKRAMDIASGMQTPMAAQLAAQATAEAKIHSFQGKPLVIAGQTVQGKPFTTADWKGKVILVDFWATWCGPCREELPRVKKAYADFHAKGLEVLGVSNDFDAKTLTDFVAADPGMPWPQLFDPTAAAAQQWNPTTTGFGIQGIPTMFLIDKQGILKSVDARADFEQEIPKLLDH